MVRVKAGDVFMSTLNAFGDKIGGTVKGMLVPFAIRASFDVLKLVKSI